MLDAAMVLDKDIRITAINWNELARIRQRLL